MQITAEQVHDEKKVVTVEFVGEGGDLVSVQMKKGTEEAVSRNDVVEKAKAVMVQIATFDSDGHDGQAAESTLTEDHSSLSPAVISLSQEREAQKNTDSTEDLDEGLAASFPASDPVAATSTTTATGRTDYPEEHSDR